MQWTSHTDVQVLEGDFKLFIKEYSNSNSLLVTSNNLFKRFINVENYSKKSFWQGDIFLINKLLDINQIYKNQLNLINNKIENIIALGGGTAIDTAKIITLLNSTHSIIYRDCEFQLKELSNIKDKPNLITIPTTIGTGSEVTSFATCWDNQKNRKYSFESSTTLAKKTILDSDLLKTLPKNIRIQTGLDTLSHLFEVLWNNNFQDYMFDDILLALKYCLTYLRELSVDNIKNDLDKKMQIAACLAGTLIQKTKTAAAHSISYPLTYIFKIPHGVAVSFTLPKLLIINSRGKRREILLKAAIKLGYKNINHWSEDINTILKNLEITNDLMPLYKSSKWEDHINEMFTPSRMNNNCEKLIFEEVKLIIIESLEALN